MFEAFIKFLIPKILEAAKQEAKQYLEDHKEEIIQEAVSKIKG